ncbi:MAG: hypothetical protein H0T51_12120 [Pirellulales bacterium]|nr:hypothetical protein [Pirellulales bacterium]
MNVNPSRRCSVVIAALTVATVGCGGSVSPTGGDVDFQTRRSMSTLASYYGDYMSATGAPPKDETAFRAYLTESAERIDRMDVGGVDGLLKSPRDGQPLVVVYGRPIAPPAAPNSPWVAHEQTGVDGKMMASKVRGEVEELTPDEVAKEFSAAKDKNKMKNK